MTGPGAGRVWPSTESRIAAGGMGEVWKGTDMVLARPVAVKLLRAEYAQASGDLWRGSGPKPGMPGSCRIPVSRMCMTMARLSCPTW